MSGQPATGLSSSTSTDSRVRFGPNVLDSIRQATVESYWNAPSRQSFWAGILRGDHHYDGRSDQITIHSYEPLGAFESNDEFLAALDAVPNLESSLGWFRTRATARDLRLIEPDLHIFERYFPEPHQTTLLLRPSNQRPLTAAIFLRDPATGKVRPTRPEVELTLAPPPPIPIAVAPTEETEPIPIRRQVPSRPFLLAALLGAAALAAVLIAVGMLAVSYFGLRLPRIMAAAPRVQKAAPAASPSSQLRITPSTTPGRWQIEWDRRWLDQLTFTTGSLAVTQGGQTVSYALSSAQVVLGRFSAPRTGDDVSVVLTVESPGRPSIEERVRLVGGLDRAVIPGR